MTQAEGQPLIDKLGRGGKVTLTLDGTEQAPYVYDLGPLVRRGGPGRSCRGLPRRRTWPRSRTASSARPGSSAIESRADCFGLELAAVHGVLRAGPPRHRAHRLRQHAGQWFRPVRGRAVRTRLGAAGRSAGRPPWRGPHAQLVRPGGPPAHRPRLLAAAPERQLLRGERAVHQRRLRRRDGRDVRRVDRGDAALRGDQLIDESPFQAVQREVPAHDGWRLPLRSMDITPPTAWRLAMRTSTAWDFRAQTGASDDVGQPATAAARLRPRHRPAGASTAGRRRSASGAFHPPEVEGAGKVERTRRSRCRTTKGPPGSGPSSYARRPARGR